MSMTQLLETENSVLPRWEYAVVALKTTGGMWQKTVDPHVDHLNELGQMGWEAVGISLAAGDLVAKPVVLLKRPLR
jgi:hypothetical protein